METVWKHGYSHTIPYLILLAESEIQIPRLFRDIQVRNYSTKTFSMSFQIYELFRSITIVTFPCLEQRQESQYWNKIINLGGLASSKIRLKGLERF
jgi:hypothetical protein